MTACTPNLRARRPTMISRWRSPSPRINVCPSSHEYSGELGQTLIRGLGERHLEIIVGRLARKYGVHAVTTKPKVAYRETFRGKAEGQGKHKKQTGGRGQYGDCWIRIAPLPRGSGVQFVDEIVGGVIPRQYIPAVERGIQEAAARGPVAGYPVVDFKAELYDGSYHDVDSNEMSFKMAGILAFRNVSPNCRPVLLEPILELEVSTPDEYQGAVMGDLSSRRGQILGTEPDGRPLPSLPPPRPSRRPRRQHLRPRRRWQWWKGSSRRNPCCTTPCRTSTSSRTSTAAPRRRTTTDSSAAYGRTAPSRISSSSRVATTA